MRLIVKKEGEGEKEYKLDKDVIHLGRGMDCEVPLTDTIVSRKHAIITHNLLSDEWAIQDNGSSNKTYLNNEVIIRSALKTGDEIRIGSFNIEVDLENSPVVARSHSCDETVDDEVLTMGASLDTPRSETVVRSPDAQHAPAMRLAAKRLTDFSQATEILCDCKSLDQMIITLMDLIIKQFDAFHVWVAFREQPSGPMTYHAGKRRDGQKVQLTDLQLQEKIKQSMEKFQSSVMPRVSAQMQEKDRIRSAMITPIMRKSGCYGLLYVDNAMVHEHYSLSDLDYLMFLAMHVAAILKGVLDI